MSTQPQGALRRLFRRTWPWLVGFAILFVIASRVPFEAFRAAIDRGPHLQLALVDLAVVIVTLCSDALSTWIGLIACGLRRPLAKVFWVRGATYVLFLINYALGQGGFGFYLRRSGATALQAVGATLFLIGTNLATLLVLTTIALAAGGTAATARLWWIVVGCDAALAAYLAVIAIAPRVLASRGMLALLFSAGVRGHALAMVGRLPHVAVIVVGIWLAVRTWGIALPFGIGMAITPVIVIASVLPIAPAGLGTTQVALVYLLSSFAAGTTDDERSAAVLAFAIVHLVYSVAASLLVGSACIPFARRAGVLGDPNSVPAAPARTP